ncbi:uncharacterized protein TNCT_693411 [Trichonephila clavata]|uniref:Uncharacterized protein n=1 Tax=Trichonephila clavata TaxID=2740835 RepID=A0A8X6LCU4_TRICU|nr:uncharacterized protein TNCT_693411 [Trichonephila clavata]
MLPEVHPSQTILKRIKEKEFPDNKCLWSVRRGPHREPPGEVPVCPGGVLPDAVPKPAHKVRQAPTPASFTPDGQFAGDRATLLRAPRGQDPHRDTYPGHAAQWEFLQLALYAPSVTHGWGTPGIRACPRPEVAHVHGRSPHASPREPQEIAFVG